MVTVASQLQPADSPAVNLPFADRSEAGHMLAGPLGAYRARPDVVVLGVACGGVPVARSVADALALPLDALFVEKIRLPGKAMVLGAVAGYDVEAWNRTGLARVHHVIPVIRQIAANARREVEGREHAWHGDRKPVDIDGRCVILVDDGLETGVSMRAAVDVARARGAADVVVAVPVAPPDVFDLFSDCEVVCLATPEPFHNIGQTYLDYTPVSVSRF